MVMLLWQGWSTGNATSGGSHTRRKGMQVCLSNNWQVNRLKKRGKVKKTINFKLISQLYVERSIALSLLLQEQRKLSWQQTVSIRASRQILDVGKEPSHWCLSSSQCAALLLKANQYEQLRWFTSKWAQHYLVLVHYKFMDFSSLWLLYWQC